MKNALIFTEENKLWIRKSNGLEYEFENVDKPELGFEYDVVVYDDIEIKVLNWDDSKGNFDGQERESLSNVEMDAIENYIKHSEPPLNVTLANQFCSRLSEFTKDNIQESTKMYGFDDLNEVMVAGREGSNHPHRSNAKRVLEFVDATAVVLDQIQMDIQATREDHLKPFEEYISFMPRNSSPLDTPR